ncbi:MAG: alpha/beta hydrolase [Myxococcota bacterium]
MADVDIAGNRLHVQRLGQSGDPVVFLHGLVMDNLSSWYFTVANPVALHRRVWLYDLRGHGRSGRPATGYRLEDHVAELLGLLDAEGLDRVTLVGHSFGGTLALAFAQTHPGRVEGLVLLDALVPDTGWGARMADTLSLDSDDRNAVIADRFQAWLGRHSERKRTKLAENAKALVHGTSLLADLRASQSWDDWSGLTMPVRLLQGRDSDVRDQGERLLAQLPNAEVVWADGTHSLLWESTERVRDQLVAWLAESPA